MKQFYVLAIAVFTTLFLTGCGPKYKNMPLVGFPPKVESTEGGIEKKLAFALVKPQMRLKGQISRGFLMATSNRFIRELEHSRDAMSHEMEKIIIQKGISVLDTYSSIDDMTYSQKKNTTGIFMPRITINMQESGTSTIRHDGFVLSTNSTVDARVRIDLLVIEPLAKERVWVRTLPSISKTIPLAYSIPPNAIASSPSMIVEPLVSATKQFDRLVLDIYDKTLDSIIKYVSLEEFQALNDDIESLKGIKRY